MAEKRAEDAASIRLNEMERDDCLLRAWVGRRDALDFLAREIADYNEIVPDHDRMVVRMVYRLVRTAKQKKKKKKKTKQTKNPRRIW